MPRCRDMPIFVSTDRQTDRQTDRPIALPLAAHARRGVIMVLPCVAI